MPCPSNFSPGKRPGTHFTECWVGPRAGQVGYRKSRATSGFDPCAIQPVASHYTEYTIPAHREYPHINFFLYRQKASYIVIFPCRTVRKLSPPTLWIYATSWSHPPSFVLFSLHSLTSLLVMSLTEQNAVDMLSMLIKSSNSMQQRADIYLLQSHSTCFGCHSTHHQEH